MFDFHKFTTDILSYKNQKDLNKYLESCFIELEEYLESLSISQINKIKFDIEDFLFAMLDAKLIKEENSKIINAFLLLIAQKLEQANLIGSITAILSYLPDSAIKNRLEASKLYLKVNDISKDYLKNFDLIIELISSESYEEEYKYKKVNSILNFYITAMENFARVANSNFAKDLKKLFVANRNKYKLLNDHLVVDIIDKLTIENYTDTIDKVCEKISNNKFKINTRDVTTRVVEREDSEYSKKLYALSEPNYNKIKQLSFDYIKSIGSPKELHDRLMRGQAIIDDKQLLYQYIVSLGAMHKTKLWSAYEQIIEQLDGQKLNIVDWGCGQAFATMILLDFIKEKNLNTKILDICLIEPSELALSRGLLHVDILQTDSYNIKAINSDIDCMKHEDIIFDNEYKTLHLFSNILDIESFKLDTNFLQKIATNIKSNNLFLCVSPKINDKRNSRIDLFYNHFDENFDTELLSARDSDISEHKRYEKIFEVKYTKQEEVEKSREKIKEKKSDHLDIYSELKSYEKHIAPILELKKIEETINEDPEYLIFKIRKVAEVITSKIYSNYESNSKNISFNDMIRYLSFEKQLFNKKITSNLHTIRTIGNINVHESDQELEGQKLDAHLMLISLLILLKELEDKELF